MLFAVGTGLGLAAATLAGATLIAAGWGSPYRYAVAAAVLIAMGGGAVGCVRLALATLPPSPPLRALRDEWQKDRTWLSRELRPAGRIDKPEHDVRSP